MAYIQHHWIKIPFLEHHPEKTCIVRCVVCELARNSLVLWNSVNSKWKDPSLHALLTLLLAFISSDMTIQLSLPIVWLGFLIYRSQPGKLTWSWTGPTVILVSINFAPCSATGFNICWRINVQYRNLSVINYLSIC